MGLNASVDVNADHEWMDGKQDPAPVKYMWQNGVQCIFLASNSLGLPNLICRYI